MPHGSLKAGAYNSWKSMMARCYKPTNDNYPRYGAKGITVCEAWHSFRNFFADMGSKPNGHVLDRKPGALVYSKNNCRWATFKESTENRCITVYLNGERVSDMAKRVGLSASAIYQRIERGWDISKIEQTPARVIRKKLGNFGSL